MNREFAAAVTAEPRLVVDRVTKVYDGTDGPVVALRDVTLHAHHHEFVAIVGPTGCGKTTLLRILAGLVPPSSGSCALNNLPIAAPTRRVALVFQRPALLPWRSVEGNLRLPTEMTGISNAATTERIEGLLQLTGLGQHKNAYPRELSVGMQQIVAFCAGLVLDPDVMLLDEPFSSVDSLSREQLGKHLLDLWSRYRKTVLFVTHSIPEAVFLADRVIVLSERPGRVLSSIGIRLPRPRSLAMVDTPQFSECAAQVRDALERSQEDRTHGR